MGPDREVLDLEVLTLWRRPAGTLDPWVRAVVAVAGVLTIAIAAIAARSWSDHNESPLGISRFWIRNAFALGLVLWLGATLIPSFRISRWIRVAVLLPVAHVLALAVVWQLWGWLSPRTPTAVQTLVHQMPIAPTFAIAAAVLVASAWLIPRGRRREFIQAAAMMALVELLLLGLWLPIGARVWCGAVRWNEFSDAVAGLAHPGRVVAFLLLPPFVVALGFTAAAIRRPEAMRCVGGYLAAAIGATFVIACALRLGGPEGPFLIYVNFVHVLCAQAVVAVGALVALGATTWMRDRHARRAMAEESSPRTGVVVPEDDQPDAVAAIEITSWLRGPRPVVHAFTVATRTGQIRVPAGASWVAPLPALTTQLHAGESMVALRHGDRVVLGGYVDADPTHPFRDSAAPTPGSRGIMVARPDGARYGLTNIALTLWRPCIAYLVILIAVGAPALAGALVYL